MHHEIAIVGAGLAGLICARELQSAGRDVVVIDKSRGLGGRLATRRLAQTHADHGLCYIKPKDDRFRAFVQEMVDREVLQVWTDRLHTLSNSELTLDSQSTPRYVAPKGSTALAKELAKDLAAAGKLYLNQQVNAIKPIANGWQLTSQNEDFCITANTLILAIPAPQALPLVEPIANPEFIAPIAQLEFSPCLTAIVAYSPEQDLQTDLRGVTCLDDEFLGWIGFDSTKQINPTQPAMIIQSNGKFAQSEFEAPDLMAVGQRLCDRTAEVLNLPWIAKPEVLQVHRWKYAFAINPIEAPFLEAKTEQPLYCIGDWCGGDRAENAFLSGLSLAKQLHPTS